jgi:putative flippase GtrA
VPTSEQIRALLPKFWRFGAVSVMNVVITQVLLIGAYGLTSMGAVAANVFAVGVSSIPAYLVNRRWVWNRRGNHSWSREILPFWGYTFAGLAVSTVAVAAVEQRTSSALAVSAANLVAFGLLWVSKFLFLDAWMFRDRGDENSAEAGEVAYSERP